MTALGSHTRRLAVELTARATTIDEGLTRAIDWTPGYAASPSTEPTARGGDNRDVGDTIIVGTEQTGHLKATGDQHTRAVANIRAELTTIQNAIRRIDANLRTLATLTPTSARLLAEALAAGPGRACANPACASWTIRTRQGRCDACYQYRRRTGTDRPHHVIHPHPDPYCPLCTHRTASPQTLTREPAAATVRPHSV